MISPRETQIELARNLLQTVRHAAYATVNQDGTPHNSPLMLIHNEDLSRLYIGSRSDTLHVRNMMRTGTAFATLYDSFVKGQGGLYITCNDVHECTGDELDEALSIHNKTRARYGSDPIALSYYHEDAPAQRMYSLTVTTIEIYVVERGEDGHISHEARVAVSASELLT